MEIVHPTLTLDESRRKRWKARARHRCGDDDGKTDDTQSSVRGSLRHRRKTSKGISFAADAPVTGVGWLDESTDAVG